MRKYISASPNAEVIGAALLALVKNLHYEETEPLLKRYGLETIEPFTWYPEQKILDLLKEIADGKTNVSENLVAIGMKASETIPLPPEIDTMEKFLTSYGARQTSTSRNTPAVLVSKLVAEHHGQVINNTPYPDDLIFGYLWSAAKRLLPPGTTYTVHPQKNADPDEASTFDVTW